MAGIGSRDSPVMMDERHTQTTTKTDDQQSVTSKSSTINSENIHEVSAILEGVKKDRERQSRRPSGSGAVEPKPGLIAREDFDKMLSTRVRDAKREHAVQLQKERDQKQQEHEMKMLKLQQEMEQKRQQNELAHQKQLQKFESERI